jgi:hypothetical protein
MKQYPLWFLILSFYIAMAAIMTPVIIRCFKSIIYNKKTTSKKHAKNMFSNPKWRIKIIVTIALWPFFAAQLIRDGYREINSQYQKYRANKIAQRNKRF